MDIRQLEGFLWIARLGSVTAACQRLNVTQSAISMRLRALEDELQVELFDRSHKKLTLTGKGQELLKYAEEIVRSVEQVRLHVAGSSSNVGRLRIGMSELIGLTWGPALARIIIDRYPNILIDVEVGVPAALMNDLVTKKLDVLIAPTVDSPPESMTAHPLGQVEFAWMSRGGEAKPRQSSPHSSVFDQTVIGYENDQSLLFPAIRRTLDQHQITETRFIGCNSIATTLEMVVRGCGISMLPKFYCRDLLASGALKIALDGSYKYNYYAMCRKKDIKGMAGVILDLAREAFIRELESPTSHPINQKR